MKQFYAVVLCSFFAVVLTAQTTDFGGPFSWNTKFQIPKIIETHSMPGFDADALAAEDAINDLTKAAPWRFGYKYDTDFSLNQSGTWTVFPNGNRLWQIELVCDGAMTVNLLFENFYLPEGAYVYLYDKDKTNRVGAYTNENNNVEMMLGTELVHGDHIVVEYFEPAAVSGQGTFTIANVIHGYRSLNRIQKDLMKALESSGNCNVDVNCPLGDGWEDQIHSVAMIVVSGNGICSGALINNTCSDGTPYFLTADHCVGGSTANWAFRFNWESPPGTEVCQVVGTSVNPGPPYDQTLNGATVLYSSGASDVALLQITNMTITHAEDWGCFYAGWDNSDALTVTQATGIHHPSGDLKKICRETNAPYHNTAAGAQVWWIADWEQGVTEPGSSGSHLFDQNKRIIGQLYGGLAACSGTNDNGQYDYYGRFGVSWPGLSPFLAPGACGTAVTNDGFDPNQPALADDAGISVVVSPTGSYCDNLLSPVVTLRNYGSNNLTSVTINYDIDGGTNNTFSWTGTLTSGSSIDVSLPTLNSPAGAHVFNANTSVPNGVADTNPANNASSSNYSATIGGELVTLTLNTDCWGYESAWQLFDETMTLVEEGGNLSVIPGGAQDAAPGDPGAYGNQAVITESFCLTPGCYTFTIYDDYGDGLDGVSEGCVINGDYEITDESAAVLTSLQTLNFGDSETTNFCLSSGCTGTVSSSTAEETCFDDCDGSITIIAAGGTLPYSYDIGSGPQASNAFTGLCAGGYVVTVEDGDNCTELVNITITGPSQMIGSTTTTDEIMGGDGSINLTVTGGTGTLDFDWTGPGAFSASTEDLTGLISGTYSVTITDDNGCSVTLNNILVSSQLTTPSNEEINFSVYPNPSTGIFTVEWTTQPNDTAEIVLTDVVGRQLNKFTIGNASTLQLDLTDKAAGTYFLSLNSGDTQKVITLIVSH